MTVMGLGPLIFALSGRGKETEEYPSLAANSDESPDFLVGEGVVIEKAVIGRNVRGELL